MDDPTTTAASGCTDEHAKFCSACTTARLHNSIHCQDCPEGRPSAATTNAATRTGYYEAVISANAAILRLGDFPEFNGFDLSALMGALRDVGKRPQVNLWPTDENGDPIPVHPSPTDVAL